MLLARAVVMTSPLVATLGLSLMIPLSVFADYVRGLARLSPQFFVGTACVFASYLLESWHEDQPPQATDFDPTEGEADDGAASGELSADEEERRRGGESLPFTPC